MDFLIEDSIKEKNVESDLGLKNEMSFAIANLIQAEEHLGISIGETQNKDLIPILSEIRKIRAKYMKEFIGKDLPSQLWCLQKHLLSTAFRLSEVAVKNMALGNNDKAVENLKDSIDLYQSVFLVVQLGGLDGNDGQSKGKN